MKNIVIIDDKDHALRQAIFEFPDVNKNDLSFRHFDSIKAFRAARLDSLFLVFLDFFLEKVHDFETTLIPELECEHLICFSSMKEMSDHMYELALKEGDQRIKHVYSVQKIKATIDNNDLQRVLASVFGTGTKQER
jgi:hypothetical protein